MSLFLFLMIVDLKIGGLNVLNHSWSHSYFMGGSCSIPKELCEVQQVGCRTYMQFAKPKSTLIMFMAEVTTTPLGFCMFWRVAVSMWNSCYKLGPESWMAKVWDPMRNFMSWYLHCLLSGDIMLQFNWQPFLQVVIASDPSRCKEWNTSCSLHPMDEN